MTLTAELMLAVAAERGTCRSPKCGAPIFWTFSERGKKFPLDRVPVDRAGRAAKELFAVRLEDDGTLRSFGVTAAWLDEDDPVFTAHWATCPDRERFRRG